MNVNQYPLFGRDIMKEEFLGAIQNREVVEEIKRVLRFRRIDEASFETVIFRLYGRPHYEITPETVDDILSYFRLKVASEYIAAPSDVPDSIATFSTYKLFNRMLRHLSRTDLSGTSDSDYKSVFDLNISNLSNLSKLSADEVTNMLYEFTTPIMDAESEIPVEVQRSGESSAHEIRELKSGEPVQTKEGVAGQQLDEYSLRAGIPSGTIVQRGEASVQGKKAATFGLLPSELTEYYRPSPYAKY